MEILIVFVAPRWLIKIVTMTAGFTLSVTAINLTCSMSKLMSMSHGGEECDRGSVFTREQLEAITPVDVKRCVCMKAHNDPDPNLQRDRPTNGRSDSLCFAKKATSFCMLHRTVPWCQGPSNPAKSALVNDMTKQVKKFEVRGEGAKSNAKRPLKQVKFWKTIATFRAQEDFNHKWKCPMMVLWQFALIGRVDDVANFKTNDPCGHGDFHFALKTKVRWSENALEERQCPLQILLGAMNHMHCVILNLAVHLEECLGLHPDAVHSFTELTTSANNTVKNLIATHGN